MHRLYLMTTIFAAFSLASPILSETQAQTNDKPVVLSVADIQNITSGAILAAELSKKGIRNQVVSDLVQNYDVIVLSRSQSYCLVVEGKVMSFSSIDTPSNNAIQLPAADLAVCATFQDKMTDGIMEGNISYADLTHKPYKIVTNVVFAVEPAKDISSQLVKQIVDTFHLHPNPAVSNKTETTNKSLTWAVLPFSGNGLKDKNKMQDSIEIALQKSGKVKNLVDRTALDKVLQELKITAMGGINQNIGGKIGKMVGADRILMGWLDTDEKGMRLDIHLVDTKSAIVIDARSKVSPKESNFEEIAGEMVIDVVKSGRNALPIQNSSADQRRAEEDFYLQLSINIHNTWGVRTLSRLTFIINNVETAFLLGFPHPEHAQKIADILIQIIKHSTPNDGENSVSPEIADRAVRIMEALLDSSAGSEWLEDPLVWRINAYMAKDDFKKALSLIDEYQNKSPNAFTEEKIRCLTKLGRMSEAQALIDRSGGISDWSQSAYKIGIATKKGKDLYEFFLKHFDYHNPYNGGLWRETKKDFDRLFELQLQYEKPEEALKVLNSWVQNPDKWIMQHGIINYAVPLQQARCLRLLGRNEDAVRKCKDVIAIPESGAGPMSDYANNAKIIIKEIETEIGPVKELWRTAAEIKPTPSSRYVYLIPAGDLAKSVLDGTAKKISLFFGSKVRMLPMIAIPNDIQKASIKDYFSAESFFNSISKEIKIPDDALFVGIITKECLLILNHNKIKKDSKDYDRKFEYVGNNTAYSPCKGNPIICSYAGLWRGAEGLERITDTISQVLILGFLRGCLPYSNDHLYFPFCMKPCHGYPCLCSVRLLGNKRTALCLDCQEAYTKVDFEKVHTDLMDYLKKAGAKIVKPEEVKFTEIGEEIKKADSKNNKPVEVKK